MRGFSRGITHHPCVKHRDHLVQALVAGAGQQMHEEACCVEQGEDWQWEAYGLKALNLLSVECILRILGEDIQA